MVFHNMIPQITESCMWGNLRKYISFLLYLGGDFYACNFIIYVHAEKKDIFIH